MHNNVHGSQGSNIAGGGVTISQGQGNNILGHGSGMHHAGIAQGGPTQETAGTSNPSNEVNANSEFIDIMRKIPRILCERYELLDVLGKGAHGRIYLATDLVTHDRVAIKLVSIWMFLQRLLDQLIK